MMEGSKTSVQFDVIISGCGPTGGTLANLLAAQGLKVCVIEKYKEVYPTPRAIVLDWEAMRILQFCGVAHTLAPTTRPHPGTDFLGLDGQLIKLFDPAPPPYALGWPSTVTFVQPELEKMLRHALQRRENVTFLGGYLVQRFEDRGGYVDVSLASGDNADNALTVRGRFLIGCDGANSIVRESLGLGLNDLEFDEWWVVVDALQRCDTDLPAKTTQYCWPSRPATYVVAPGNLRRWELKLLPGESPEKFKDEEALKAILEPYVDISCFDIWRHATYRFAARTGKTWASNRVFLAGDSVHQTPPFLAQGLCAGMRDAANLAWKLAWVIRNGWNQALLDSYQAERQPHVESIVQSAKEFGLIIGELDEGRAKVRDNLLRTELLSGRMTTTRQAFVPPLTGGLVGSWPMAGTLMVQPKVRAGGKVTLMDDLLPAAFLFVTWGKKPQSWLDGLEGTWGQIQGERVALGHSMEPDAGYTCLELEDSIFDDWSENHQVEAVIVRPDRHVHAVIRSREELEACLRELAETLRADQP